jgi:heme/copper-type cytochrome/quinol oxidase subunit 2
MLIWALLLAILTILSYLSDIGVFSVLKTWRVPFINASLMSFLILLIMIAMLVRILIKLKKREREALGAKVLELEKELKALKEKTGI